MCSVLICFNMCSVPDLQYKVDTCSNKFQRESQNEPSSHSSNILSSNDIFVLKGARAGDKNKRGDKG